MGMASSGCLERCFGPRWWSRWLAAAGCQRIEALGIFFLDAGASWASSRPGGDTLFAGRLSEKTLPSPGAPLPACLYVYPDPVHLLRGDATNKLGPGQYFSRMLALPRHPPGWGGVAPCAHRHPRFVVWEPLVGITYLREQHSPSPSTSAAHCARNLRWICSSAPSAPAVLGVDHSRTTIITCTRRHRISYESYEYDTIGY